MSFQLKLKDGDDEDKKEGSSANAIDRIKASIKNNQAKLGDSTATLNNEKAEVLIQSDEYQGNGLQSPEEAEDELLSYEEVLEEDDPDTTKAKVKRKMQEKVGGIVIPSKYKLWIILAGVVALLVVVYLVNGGASLMPDREPKGAPPTAGQSNAGGITTAPQKARPQIEVEAELKALNPGASIAFDATSKQFTVLMQLQNGSTLKTTTDENGKILQEVVLNATPANGVPNQAAAPDNTKITIERADYQKSTLSLPVQEINPSNTAYTETGERHIVKYQKLPLNGKIPYLHTTLDETGEVVIFPITLDQYMSLKDSGSTVISFIKVSSYGVVTYNNVSLVDWQGINRR